MPARTSSGRGRDIRASHTATGRSFRQDESPESREVPARTNRAGGCRLASGPEVEGRVASSRAPATSKRLALWRASW